MADKKCLGVPPPSLSSPCHQTGRIGGVAPKPPLHHHYNGSVEARLGCRHLNNTCVVPQSAPNSRTSGSTLPFRTLRALGGLVSPGLGLGPEGSSTRPRGQSLGSALGSRTRSMTFRNKRRSSQQEEPEALLDLILECQGQRLEDQRASLSLLPDPRPALLCEACSPDQPSQPSLDFYYMLVHYQSDRMEDQRCPLPDLDNVVGSVPEGQEDFFSLIQRVQSRRMDEQRASLLLTHTDDINTLTTGSSPHHHYHH